MSTANLSSDEARVSWPPSVRAQSAVVRTLSDAIAHLSARGDAAEGLREQLADEETRLQRQQDELAERIAV